MYDDILDETMEYFGLTLLVFKENPGDDDAQIKLGYNTAAVRIVDDDGRVYVTTRYFSKVHRFYMA